MIDIQQIWRAGRVRRWHMNPDLMDTMDPNDGHCARAARLLLALWPDTPGYMLRAALTHDDEELFIGDMGKPAKEANPEAYAALEAVGRVRAIDMWCGPVSEALSGEEIRRLKFCDRLDAFMWMRHNKPWLQERDNWEKDRDWLEYEAIALGIEHRLPDGFWGFE